LVFFVDHRALPAVRATKVASDYDSDCDTYAQPGRNVAGDDAHGSANAGAQNNAQRDLHGWFLHVLLLKTVSHDERDGRGRPSSIGLRYFPLPSGFSVLSPI
jgi:hypothetical protein